MPQSPAIASFSSIALVTAGAITCALAARPLVADPSLRPPLNPFGLKTSPYGEVLAMAMQSPIDQYWHKGFEQTAASSPSSEEAPPSSSRLQSFIGTLDTAFKTRTNPKPPSPAHRLHIRRQIEDKLRFAYELDPSHYANYNSYHFFLTEPQLGTRPELTPGAAGLAEETIRYCLSREDDPRPALTAAAAAGNVLELMFNDRLISSPPRFTTGQMRPYLDILDQSIARYDQLSSGWEANGQWDLLSPYRRAECEERYQYILKFRQAAATTIDRLESEALGTSNFELLPLKTEH